MTMTNEQRKDRQRKAVMMLEKLVRLSKGSAVNPPVMAGSVRVVRALLIDDDEGGNGMTATQLEERLDLNQSAVNKGLALLPAILATHCPEAGVKLVREREDGKTYRHSLVWLRCCAACGGTGVLASTEGGEAS